MWCDTCKVDVPASGITPKCPECKSYLITILHIGEVRLTGKIYKFPEFKFRSKWKNPYESEE